jgi:ribosomal protein L37AE/L43A
MIYLKNKVVTSSSMRFEYSIDDGKTLKTVEFYLVADKEDIKIDELDVETNTNKNNTLSLKDDNLIEVDVNYIGFEDIFYKDFYFNFLFDDDSSEKSNRFKIEPIGRKDLYGIVSKMKFDFDRLWTVSGTKCLLFVKNPTAEMCPKCYNKELQQRISTNCDYCNNTGQVKMYIPIEFKARIVKTQTQQAVTPKGIVVYSTSIFTTFARLNFILGNIIFDITSRQFYEIKGASISNVSGVRSSTRITAQYIPSNDSRVIPLLELIP